MDVVEAKTQRSNDISDRFVANMRDALVQTATQIANMALDVAPGGDCIRGAINVAQGDSVGLGNGVGCALDIVPVVGNAASTVFRYGDDAIEAVHDAGRAADRAGDARALDTPSWGQVDGPSINRVTPEPPTVRAPEPKQLDAADAGPRRVDDAPSHGGPLTRTPLIG